ncbi:MAG TPA: outer membrane protein assembly factor BamD, partial [Planctomycetota bacterium]|nr:outer membrane protein assembly factor BamD [Planctomycetota bacterium]
CDRVVKTYKTGEWVERAALLKARAAFRGGDLKKADRELTRVRKRFPCTATAREVSDLQFAIGASYIDRGKYTGVRILEEMVENNPYGPRSDEAQFKIGEYYLRKRHHVEAAEAFALVIAQYKDSRYREDAMFLRAREIYLENEGPKRDPLPYEEARVNLTEYLKDYPEGKHATEARGLLEKIETALARKHYLIAEYYRGQGQRRAAQRYYRYVVERYPNSKWTGKALKRLPKEKPAPASEPPKPEVEPKETPTPEPEAPAEPADEAPPTAPEPTDDKPVEDKGEPQ